MGWDGQFNSLKQLIEFFLTLLSGAVSDPDQAAIATWYFSLLCNLSINSTFYGTREFIVYVP